MVPVGRVAMARQNVFDHDAARNSVPDAGAAPAFRPESAFVWVKPLASTSCCGEFPSGTMQLSPSRRALLNRCGAVVLFAGICLGAFIYWSAPPTRDGASADAVDVDSSLTPEDSRRYAHDTEVNFGKVGLLLDEWMRAGRKLGEPRPLAITIIVVSALVAGGCFLVGGEKRIPRGD